MEIPFRCDIPCLDQFYILSVPVKYMIDSESANQNYINGKFKGIPFKASSTHLSISKIDKWGERPINFFMMFTSLEDVVIIIFDPQKYEKVWIKPNDGEINLKGPSGLYVSYSCL